MRYMLLLYQAQSDGPAPGTPESDALMAKWWEYHQSVQDAGVFQGGEALFPTDTATTVHVADSETVTTDGPFAETAEQLGGYYILDCADLDEAVRWAAKVPTAYTGGRVEIRPIVDMADLAPADGTASAEGAPGA